MTAKRKPKPVEPGAMKRGKLFRLDKGWVFVSPEPLDPGGIEMTRRYWEMVSSDPIVVVPSTDLMVGDGGQLYVKDVAFAFPEPEVT